MRASGANFSDVWDFSEGNRLLLKDNTASLNAGHSQRYGGVSCFPGAFVAVRVSGSLLYQRKPLASRQDKFVPGHFYPESGSVKARRAAQSAAADSKRNWRTVFSYRTVY